MGSTTFSGPVTSTNGFVGSITGAVTATTVTATTGVRAGASTAAISAAAVSVNQFYTTATNTTGDHRGIYARTNFTGVGGSGETLRAFSTVAAAVATGGTVNGAHISLSVNAGGSVSGAGNAARFTLGLADTVNPGGTLAVLQVDSDLHNGSTVPASTSFLRFTNSNTKTIANLMNVPTAMVVAHVAADSTHSLQIIAADGTPYYVMCTSVAP